MATKIYQGNSNYTSDQIYTVDNGKIYKGNSTYSSDQLSPKLSDINIVDFKKVYKGKSTYTSDQIMTISDKKVYKGNSTYTSDQIATIEGDRLSDRDFQSVISLLAQKNNLI